MSTPDAAVRGIALFLDFDGTLVDIAPRPEEVVVDPGLVSLLSGLRRQLNGALAIVTGRPVSDLDHFLPGLDLDACGLHGLERRVGGRVLDPDALPDISAEAERVSARLADRPEVLIENKRIGFAVHWRLAPDAEDEVRAATDEALSRLGPGYRIQDGKAVREIVPASAGKGAGIRQLMAIDPYRGRDPVFVGDDRTDEDGFAELARMGGVGVKIGPGPTLAQYRLASPRDLRTVLTGWLDHGFSADQLGPA